MSFLVRWLVRPKTPWKFSLAHKGSVQQLWLDMHRKRNSMAASVWWLNPLWRQLPLHTLDKLSWPCLGCGYVFVDLRNQTSLLLSPKLDQSLLVLINSSLLKLSSHKISLYLPGNTFSGNKSCNGRQFAAAVVKAIAQGHEAAQCLNQDKIPEGLLILCLVSQCNKW